LRILTIPAAPLSILSIIIPCGIATLAGLGVLGCGDDGAGSQGPCASEILVNTVPASPAVRDVTDVASYRYEAPLDDTALHVHLRDDQGRALGAMRVEQGEDGAMMAALGDVRLVTRGQRQGQRRLAVRYALSVGDAPVLQIRALLEDLSCGMVSERRSLGCAPGVSLDPEDGLVVPSCGLDYDGRLADRQLPTVTALSYGVTPSASDAPELVRARSFDAIDEGVPAEETARVAWLDNAGVLDALRTPDARRLLAAYGDPGWRRVLGDHVAACITDGAFTFSDPADDGVAARREPLTSGTNGNRNEDAWGGSGDRRGASSKGDPHLVTFDGRAYDMQSQAELVLARSTGGAADPLEVQARFEPRSGGRDVPLCRSVSLTTAVAARFGDHVIEVRPDATLVDGVPLGPEETPDVAGTGGRILRSDGTITLVWADGTELEVGRGAGTVRVDMVAAPGRAGRLEGLFGDADGDPNDDLIVRGSGPLPRPASFEAIHRDLRSSWVVDGDTSLFTYAEGEGPDDFDVPSFPEIPADPALIPPAERGELEDTCRGRGARGVALTDCVLDLYCLQDPSSPTTFARTVPWFRSGPAESPCGGTSSREATARPSTCRRWSTRTRARGFPPPSP